MIIVRKKQKIHISYFNFFESCFLRCSYLKTNESIKMFWLLNTIFPNKLQFYYLVPFTYKILAFQTFCFGLIVQLLPFIIAGFLTNNSFHTFEACTNVGQKFSGWGWDDTLLITRTRLILLITVIFNSFDWLYLLLTADKTNSFPVSNILNHFYKFVSSSYLAKWFLHSSDK